MTGPFVEAASRADAVGCCRYNVERKEMPGLVALVGVMMNLNLETLGSLAFGNACLPIRR